MGWKLQTVFDIRLANKTYCTQSWGVLGLSGAPNSWNSVRIAGTPVETRGTKEVYFLKTLNYTNKKI